MKPYITAYDRVLAKIELAVRETRKRTTGKINWQRNSKNTGWFKRWNHVNSTKQWWYISDYAIAKMILGSTGLEFNQSFWRNHFRKASKIADMYRAWPNIPGLKWWLK